MVALLSGIAPPLHYSDYHHGQGPAFHEQACKLELEGIVSKRADAPYTPGNRGLWVKVKCLHCAEFVVVGWTDPERSRPYLGALLLAYYELGASSTPVRSGLGSSRPSWSGSGEGWRSLLPTRCRCTRHRPEPTALGHH